jgi:hypothetical protein
MSSRQETTSQLPFRQNISGASLLALENPNGKLVGIPPFDRRHPPAVRF